MSLLRWLLQRIYPSPWHEWCKRWCWTSIWQLQVVGKIEEQVEERPHMEHIPPIMKIEVDRMRHDNCLLSCKHVADKVRSNLRNCFTDKLLTRPGVFRRWFIPCERNYRLRFYFRRGCCSSTSSRCCVCDDSPSWNIRLPARAVFCYSNKAVSTPKSSRQCHMTWTTISCYSLWEKR